MRSILVDQLKLGANTEDAMASTSRMVWSLVGLLALSSFIIAMIFAWRLRITNHHYLTMITTITRMACNLIILHSNHICNLPCHGLCSCIDRRTLRYTGNIWHSHTWYMCVPFGNYYSCYTGTVHRLTPLVFRCIWWKFVNVC